MPYAGCWYNVTLSLTSYKIKTAWLSIILSASLSHVQRYNDRAEGASPIGIVPCPPLISIYLKTMASSASNDGAASRTEKSQDYGATRRRSDELSSQNGTEDGISDDAQAGVQVVQAATTVWGKKHLIAAYIMSVINSDSLVRSNGNS